jgi:CRISPR-associated protein Csb1
VALPLVVTRFDDADLPKKFSVTSLEAPHRLADALFRDSLLDDVIFRKSGKGRVLDMADVRNATGLFGLCPTALVFGLWDSTGPRGGLGAKFQRALVSEIVGYGAVPGVKTASRIDQAQIRLDAGTLYERAAKDDDKPNWTRSPQLAVEEKSKPKPFGKNRETRGKPSAAVHGNITPTVSDGGFTISHAQQTTTLSLAVLRRLRFPLDGAVEPDPKVDLAARTTLAALGLAAGSMAREDVDLRSRCHLFAEGPSVWQLLDRPGEAPAEFALDADAALTLLNDAITAAQEAGLPWDGVVDLTPSAELIELVRRSQELASESGVELS